MNHELNYLVHIEKSSRPLVFSTRYFVKVSLDTGEMVDCAHHFTRKGAKRWAKNVAMEDFLDRTSGPDLEEYTLTKKRVVLTLQVERHTA